MADIKYDVLGLKKEGFTDEQIALAIANAEGKTDVVTGMLSEGFSPKQVISAFNKTSATPLDTFLSSAKQEAGSEIKGIYQMAGGELDTASESQRRQMESENPVSGFLGTLVGGLANPSTLIPGSLVFKGAKGLVAGGVAAGATGGFLQPRYEEEDFSRATSTAIGAVGGGALVGALVGGQKGLSKVFNKLTGAIEEVPVNKIDPTFQEVLPETKLPVQENATFAPIEPVATPTGVQDNVTPFIQRIADAETKAKVEQDIGTGNYSSFFTESPLRFTETPDFRYTDAFKADNPNRELNIDAAIASSQKRLDESEKVMREIVGAFAPQLRSELGLTSDFKNFTPDVAAQFMKIRGLEEVAPAEVLRAVVPLIDEAKKKMNIISELWDAGTKEGLTPAELTAMFKADIEAVKPFLVSSLGSARNAGKALQAQAAVKKALGGMSPASVRKILASAEGKSDIEQISTLMDMFKAIDAAPGTVLDKQLMKDAGMKQVLSEPTWKDKFGEFVVNSYISGLATTAVNAASGIAKIGLLGTERILQTLNPFSKAKFGELVPAFRGMMDGMLEGAYFAKEGFLTGRPSDADLADVTGRLAKGAIGTQEGATKAEKIAGQIIRTPGKLSVGVDEYFKAIFRKMEFNAEAYRLASSGKYGDKETVYNALRKINTGAKDWKDQLYKAEGISGLSDDARQALASRVSNFAKSATFQADLGKFGQSLLRFRAAHPEMAFIIPFVKTPINIMKDALSYTPLNVFSKNMTPDQKIARTAIGLGLATGVGQLIESQQITGSYPRDADKRNAMIASGLPEYSMKIGDTWYSYARVEPLATLLASTVDGTKAVIDYSKKPNTDPKKEKELVVDVVAGITKNIASKTFLEGISGVMQAIHDPERYGGSFINSFAGLLVPSFIAAGARTQDPYQRVVTGFGEAVQNRIPDLGLGTPIPSRTELPAQSMLYGGERANPSYGLAAFTGLQTAPAAQTALQKEAARVKFDYDLPTKKLKGVELNGADQAEYQRLSSKFAEPALEKLVSSTGYQRAPDPMKKLMLEQRMSMARSLATDVMFMKKRSDSEFMNEYVRLLRVKRGLEAE